MLNTCGDPKLVKPGSNRTGGCDRLGRTGAVKHLANRSVEGGAFAQHVVGTSSLKSRHADEVSLAEQVYRSLRRDIKPA